MAVPAGRTNNLFGWNAYEWANDYRYVAAGWTVTPTLGATTVSLAVTPPATYPYAGGVMGVLYGLKTGQGYERRSGMVAAAAAGVVALRELVSKTQYYLIPIMRTADGLIIRGPESGILTT